MPKDLVKLTVIERAGVDEILRENPNRCPHVEDRGDGFYTCSVRIKKETERDMGEYRTANAVINNILAQIHCGGKFTRCNLYKEDAGHNFKKD